MRQPLSLYVVSTRVKNIILFPPFSLTIFQVGEFFTANGSCAFVKGAFINSLQVPALRLFVISVDFYSQRVLMITEGLFCCAFIIYRDDTIQPCATGSEVLCCYCGTKGNPKEDSSCYVCLHLLFL